MPEETPQTLDQALDNAPPVDDVTPEATTASEPQATPEAAEPTQAQAQPAEEWGFDYEYQGQPQKLSRDQVKYLIDVAVSAFEEAQQKQAQPQQPQQPQAQPRVPADGNRLPDLSSPEAVQKFIQEEIKRGVESQTKDVVSEVQQWRRETQAKEMEQQLDATINAHPELKRVASDPEGAKTVKGFLLSAFSQGGISFQQAGQRVARLLEQFGSAKTQEYVQGKIKQAGQKIEGQGGASPAPGGKQLGPDDLWEGNIKNAVAADLMQAMVGE